MQAIRLTLFAVGLAAAGCGTSTPTGTTSATAGATTATSGTGTTGGGSSSGSTSGSKISPFVGSWNCVYSGTYQLAGSSTVHTNPAYMATGVVGPGTTTDLVITGVNPGSSSGLCAETLDVTGTDTASFSPTEQSCTFTDTNGDHQTNTRTGTLTVSGATATLTETGTFTGTTPAPASTPYSGTYQGTWNCTN